MSMRICLIFLQIFSLTLALSRRSIVKTTHSPGGYHYHGRSSEDDKIAGGLYVQHIKDFPWIVSLTMYNEHQCGSCLLTLNFVLTACHCVALVPTNYSGLATPDDSVKLDAYTLIAGTANLKNYDESVQIGKPVSIHFHPKCQNLKSIIYDMGLIKMRKPFVQTPYVQPVKIDTSSKKKFTQKYEELFKTDNDPTCVVAGWGDPRAGNFSPNIPTDRLKILEMFVMPEVECEREWLDIEPTDYKNFHFWDYGQICVVSENGNESDCAGDSGSPFVCDGLLVATVSYGTDACAEGAPSIYQTISELFDWIKQDFRGQINLTIVQEPKRNILEKGDRQSHNSPATQIPSKQPTIASSEFLIGVFFLVRITLGRHRE